MSCQCGALEPADCPALAELRERAAVECGALSGEAMDVGAFVDWDKVHRAMWCLLHPFQCRRDPKTGRPRLALDDIVVLGVVAFAWWKLTDEG